MVRAFVFGKFLPFHKGHQAMIKFALTKCDHLTVLVCCSDREDISPDVRKSWIEQTFQENNCLEIVVFNYQESEYPNTSVSSQEVSAIWSRKFKELLPDCSLLVTSEPYGEFVAAVMGIMHVPFDMDRTKFPVSATRIRNNPAGFWDYVPQAVKPYYRQKIVLLGTESTGKTTLTQLLAKHYGASHVQEAGRDLIADSNSFCLNDLYTVANEHARRIAACPVTESPLLFIDTDVHITQSYAGFMFDKQLDLPETIYKHNKASLYLYLANDVPHVQDGSRLNEKERNLLDQSHRQTLLHFGIHYHEIRGNWQARFDQAIALINESIVMPAIQQ